MERSKQEERSRLYGAIRRMLLSDYKPTAEKLKDIEECYIELQHNAESVQDIEVFIDIIFRHYNERKPLPDEEKTYLYNLCMNAYCKTAQQGGIQSKWVLGIELIKPTYNLKTDVTLGNFLITLAAHEGHSDACDYLANRYCLFNFNEFITQYWLDKSRNIRWWEKKGEPINLTLIEEGNIMYISLVN